MRRLWVLGLVLLFTPIFVSAQDCPDITLTVLADAGNSDLMHMTWTSGLTTPFTVFKSNSPDGIIHVNNRVDGTTDYAYDLLTLPSETILFFSICDGDCGDGTCQFWEDEVNCLGDCHCGDGTCQEGEADEPADGVDGVRHGGVTAPGEVSVGAGPGARFDDTWGLTVPRRGGRVAEKRPC